MPPALQGWLIRGWRLLALGLAAYLLQHATPPADTPLRELSLEEVRGFFPEAAKIHLGTKQELLVEDQFGNPMGHFVTTSPDADKIIGYSGPSNVLVALDTHDRIVGTRIISSEDTPDHVDTLRNNGDFERSLKQWRPASEPTPKLQGYAGSTLTAYSIAESIQKRLSGHYASLRFPSQLTLKEIQEAGFPDAHGFEPNTPRLGWNLVRSANGTLLGYLVRTSPSADEINGYAGPTESLIAMEPDGIKLKKITLHQSYDTPDYVNRVIVDDTYLQSLTHWNALEWSTLNFEKERLEGVAGATFTSYAVAEGIKRRFADDQTHQIAAKEQQMATYKAIGLWLFILGALIMTFTPLHGDRRVRLAWQVLLIGGLGLWLGQLLSLSLFAGWTRHGLPWTQSLALVALGVIALVIPWSARRQTYCHHACPHGAAQEILGKLSPWKIRVGPRWHQILRFLPGLTLAVAFLTTLLWPTITLNHFEPFDAWSLPKIWTIPALLALVGLGFSLFIPQAYCKYGCPTGSLFHLVRTNNKHETWALKDTFVAGVLMAGFVILKLHPSENFNLVTAQATGTEQPIAEMHGVGFGTSWTVKIRGKVSDQEALHREIATEVNRIEYTLSHWRKNSVTSQFNAFESTAPFKITTELAEVLSFTQKLTQATHGTYDVSVAPLVSAWSYGPAGQNLPDPTQVDLDKILPQVGWDKVTLDTTNLTLRKAHPKLSLDLGSVLQGYAEDHIEAILLKHNYHDYLIEVGGELLASGTWPVGIEDPFNTHRMIATVMLKDQSISPSGLYREKRIAAGKPVSHIISPQTGWPVTSSLEMCCAFDRHCFIATGWATACMTAGWDDAKIIAEREGLAVWLINAKGEIWKSSKAPQ